MKAALIGILACTALTANAGMEHMSPDTLERLMIKDGYQLLRVEHNQCIQAVAEAIPNFTMKKCKDDYIAKENNLIETTKKAVEHQAKIHSEYLKKKALQDKADLEERNSIERDANINRQYGKDILQSVISNIDYTPGSIFKPVKLKNSWGAQVKVVTNIDGSIADMKCERLNFEEHPMCELAMEGIKSTAPFKFPEDKSAASRFKNITFDLYADPNHSYNSIKYSK